MDIKERKIALDAHLSAVEDSAQVAMQDGTIDPENVLYHTQQIRQIHRELLKRLEEIDDQK